MIATAEECTLEFVSEHPEPVIEPCAARHA
jgi:hypothetical protein